ncbi:hypothetical protein ACLGI4_28975 [Streptomyces sp. HMX112]|uniref:hypothetical protein n=1 Tax=Streptomyces sp. HMX112 TaxID=3390850 RepID=UPI003A80A3FB
MFDPLRGQRRGSAALAASPADAEGGQPLTGTEQGDLPRTAGFGAYAPLTLRPVPGRGAEAIVTAACPEETAETAKVAQLHRTERYGP